MASGIRRGRDMARRGDPNLGGSPSRHPTGTRHPPERTSLKRDHIPAIDQLGNSTVCAYNTHAIAPLESLQAKPCGQPTPIRFDPIRRR